MVPDGIYSSVKKEIAAVSGYFPCLLDDWLEGVWIWMQSWITLLQVWCIVFTFTAFQHEQRHGA